MMHDPMGEWCEICNGEGHNELNCPYELMDDIDDMPEDEDDD